MVANMDTTAGVTSFFSARLDAWHQLGTVTEGCLTARDALSVAHLANWNVRKVPLMANVTVPLSIGPTVLSIPMPDHFGIVRDNPIIAGQVDSLHVSKGRYTVIQNEEITALADAIVGESSAHFETGGAIDGGRKVFLSMKLPSHIMVGGVDMVGMYLTVVTSHDGTMPMIVMITPIRVVCQNTLNLALATADNVFKVRHTSGAQKAIVQQAREALDFSFRYLESFESQAEQLINTTLTQATFEEIIAIEFGVADDAPAATRTRAQNKIDAMSALFSDAGTQANIRGTAWAGLNAMTEYVDHYSPVRGGDEDLLRARKAILDPSAKNRALDLILAAV